MSKEQFSKKDPAYNLIGLIDAEFKDNNIAKNHDQYLYDKKKTKNNK